MISTYLFPILGGIAVVMCIIGTVIAIRLLIKDANSQHEHHPEHGYAGFWKRLAAYIIDLLILLIGIIILSLILGSATRGLATIAGWLYFSLMENSQYQATLGKMALGIKVTDIHGNKISFGRATGRYFGKILSGLTILAGYIMIACTRRKQGLHDMLADTLVIRTK